MRIGFLGYGEAARAFVDSLAGDNLPLEFAAYDILLDDPQAAEEMREAMGARNTRIATDAASLAPLSDWIVSAVTAGQSLTALEPLVPALQPGHVVVDINSVSPERKRASARLVEGQGADYLDMAVMAPVHPRGHRTPVLLAGHRAQVHAPALAALGFDLRVVDEAPGAATAIKMVRSLFVKGLEALTVETLLAAEAAGCRAEIAASLGASFEWFDRQPGPAYQFERTLRHGTRRAEEMVESAATLDALGLQGGLAREIAAVQARMGQAGGSGAPSAATLDEMIPRILRARGAAARGYGRQ